MVFVVLVLSLCLSMTVDFRRYLCICMHSCVICACVLFACLAMCIRVRWCTGMSISLRMSCTLPFFLWYTQQSLCMIYTGKGVCCMQDKDGAEKVQLEVCRHHKRGQAYYTYYCVYSNMTGSSSAVHVHNTIVGLPFKHT